MRRSSLWRAAALASLLAGCGGEGALEGEQGPESRVGDDANLYFAEHRKIPVTICWERVDQDGNDVLTKYAQQIEWTREGVEETWGRYAGIRVVGWDQPCAKPIYGYGGAIVGWTPGIQGFPISVRPERPKVSGGLGGSASWMQLNFTNWCNNIEGCIKFVAVHEFGHLLGFAHEQNRPDTPLPRCEDPQGSYGSRTTGPWDPYSIMNYCRDNDGLYSYNDDSLTSLDIYGARRFYGHECKNTGTCPTVVGYASRPWEAYGYTVVTPEGYGGVPGVFTWKRWRTAANAPIGSVPASAQEAEAAKVACAVADPSPGPSESFSGSRTPCDVLSPRAMDNYPAPVSLYVHRDPLKPDPVEREWDVTVKSVEQKYVDCPGPKCTTTPGYGTSVAPPCCNAAGCFPSGTYTKIRKYYCKANFQKPVTSFPYPD